MKHRKKGDLPTKACVTCGLPFAWRKKWARDWDEVRHCSEKCRRSRDAEQGTSPSSTPASVKRGGG
jgi:hypothetical protein